MIEVKRIDDICDVLVIIYQSLNQYCFKLFENNIFEGEFEIFDSTECDWFYDSIEDAAFESNFYIQKYLLED